MRSLNLARILCCVGVLTNLATAADPVDWLPDNVNAVARINVADVYKSPLAKKEGWLKQSTESFIQQESFIPPGTNQILIGSELDLSDNLISIKKYSLIVPDKSLTLEKLSAWLPGGIEKLAGKPSAQFGNDGYVVDTEEGFWLTTTSASRQFMTRWLKNGPATAERRLSPYLRAALQSKEQQSQFVLAIDLQENFSESEVAENLKTMDWIGSEAVAKNVAEVLASAKGVTIRINVDTTRTGSATVDFGKDTAPLKPVLDQLIEEVLNRVGASSEDIDRRWTSGERVRTGFSRQRTRDHFSSGTSINHTCHLRQFRDCGDPRRRPQTQGVAQVLQIDSRPFGRFTRQASQGKRQSRALFREIRSQS